ARNRISGLILTACSLVAVSSPDALTASQPSVYTMTNSPRFNGVVVYRRSGDGTLTGPEVWFTGGTGTGMSLASQGSLAMTDDGGWMLACNAGSNDITLFAVNGDGSLAMRSKTPSGGTMPVSITVKAGIAFVLNAGGTPNITGFTLGRDGSLP